MSMSIPVMLDEVLLYPIATRHALSSCWLCKVHNTNIQVTCFNYPPTWTTRYVTTHKKKDGDSFMSMGRPVMPDEVLLYPIATHRPLPSCRLYKAHNKNIHVTCFYYPPARTTWYVTRRKTWTIHVHEQASCAK